MSDIANEPAFEFFSHVRKALAAMGLAALGAVVLVGLMPLAVGLLAADQVQPTSAREEARKVPQASLAK